MTHHLALAILLGLAGYGVLHVVGDVADWWERHTFAGVRDWQRQRHALHQRANPVPRQRPTTGPRAMRSTDR